jgi:hypothetical protein
MKHRKLAIGAAIFLLVTLGVCFRLSTWQGKPATRNPVPLLELRSEPDVPSPSRPSSGPIAIRPRPASLEDPALYVVDADENAIAGAYVADGKDVLGKTDEEGLFTLKWPPTRVLVWADEYEPTEVAILTEDLFPGARKTCVLSRGAKLSGRVLDQDGKGVPNVLLSAVLGGSAASGDVVGGIVGPQVARLSAHVRAVTTGVDGSFQFSGLRQGRYVLRLMKFQGFMEGGRQGHPIEVPSTSDAEIRVRRAFAAVLVPRLTRAAHPELVRKVLGLAVGGGGKVEDTDAVELLQARHVIDALQSRLDPGPTAVILVRRAARGTPSTAVITASGNVFWPDGQSEVRVRFVAADLFQPSDVSTFDCDADPTDAAVLIVKSSVECGLESGKGGFGSSYFSPVRNQDGSWRFEVPAGDYVLVPRHFRTLLGRAWRENVALRGSSPQFVDWSRKEAPAVLTVRVHDAAGLPTTRYALNVSGEWGQDFLMNGETAGAEVQIPSLLGKVTLLLFDDATEEVARQSIEISAGTARPVVDLSVAR